MSDAEVISLNVVKEARAQRTIRALVDLVADAYDLGYRAGLNDGGVDPITANYLKVENECMHEVSARLYVAQVQATLTKA